jgi:hypothetical protein
MYLQMLLTAPAKVRGASLHCLFLKATVVSMGKVMVNVDRLPLCS